MTTQWTVPNSPWWWHADLGQVPLPPGTGAQAAFRRQLTLAGEDVAARRRGPIDVGTQRQIPDGACWGDACHYRRPGPNAGREVDRDPLGLCPECREEIVP